MRSWRSERGRHEGTKEGGTRYEIMFSGRVQGVGFRWTACRVARRFDIRGWVRNEPDGSVRCVAEGEANVLDEFVVAVQEAMEGNITGTRITEGAADGDLDGFGVRY